MKEWFSKVSTAIILIMIIVFCVFIKVYLSNWFIDRRIERFINNKKE